MTRRHLPWGWSCGGLPGPEAVAAAWLVSCPPALSSLTPSLLSAGFFKISSMEKDRPSFFGASQHSESFLSIALQRAGHPQHSPWAAARRGRGGFVCTQGDEGGGWRVAYFLPRDSWNQEGKWRWRTGSLMSDYPSTILSSRGLPWATSNYPWDQGGRSHGKSWNGLCPVPTDSEISPGQCQGSCHCQIGFRFTAKGLLRVVSLSLPLRPGVPRSLPLGNRASSWK